MYLSIRRLLFCALIVLCIAITGLATQSLALQTVEIPILSVVETEGEGAVELMVMQWDGSSTPNPLTIQWARSNVKLVNTAVNAYRDAYSFAASQHGSSLTGTLTLLGHARSSVHTDGNSAGAVMAVGFLAVFRGDTIKPGIAMTGTIEPNGKIGRVGGIPFKLKAAAREGYRTVLVPKGQLVTPKWDLSAVAHELQITVIEVDTIQEAYSYFTGTSL